MTEGHCAVDINQAAYSNNGVKIGTVVSHMPERDSLQPVRSRGHTLIRLDDDFDLEVYFAGVGAVKKGDSVTKFGEQSAETTGRIADVYNNGSYAEQTIIGSVVTVPGDSGSPWYTARPTLVAISASSSDTNDGGDDRRSQAQPAGALVNLIRQMAGPWGADFRVWVK